MFDNKGVETIFEEINYGCENEIYLALADSKRVYFYTKNSDRSDSIGQRFLQILRTIFLPEGFPDSVSVDYIQYQIWDTLQAFCSTVTGILSTRAIMEGVGVGNEAATPLGATVTWILKDGTGHIGRIVFAWWKGSDLDINSKRWRLVADILNDLALGIELLFLPFFMTWSMQILCFTTAIKAVVGVAGGATRSALTQHHSLRGNLADVSAKDGSQETFVNLCASMVALLILLTIDSKMMALSWFVLFTLLHIFANYKAVRSIRLKVLNTSRLLRVYTTYMKHKYVPTIEQVNKNESIIFGQDLCDYNVCGYRIKLGQSLKSKIENGELRNLKNAKSIYKQQQFCINIFENNIYISFRKNHSPTDVLQAYFHALIVGATKSKSDKIQKMLDVSFMNIRSDMSDDMIFTRSCLAWSKFKESLENEGWATYQHLLPVGECRAMW